MAEVLGIGLTHYPGLFMLDKDAPVILRHTLAHGKVPAELKEPKNWPELMRREWASDEGAAATRAHRERCFASLRRIRDAMEEFNPDFILMWGDDQYRLCYERALSHAFINTMLYLDCGRTGFDYPILNMQRAHPVFLRNTWYMADWAGELQPDCKIASVPRQCLQCTTVYSIR